MLIPMARPWKREKKKIELRMYVGITKNLTKVKISSCIFYIPEPKLMTKVMCCDTIQCEKVLVVTLASHCFY